MNGKLKGIAYEQTPQEGSNQNVAAMAYGCCISPWTKKIASDKRNSADEMKKNQTMKIRFQKEPKDKYAQKAKLSKRLNNFFKFPDTLHNQTNPGFFFWVNCIPHAPLWKNFSRSYGGHEGLLINIIVNKFHLKDILTKLMPCKDWK